MKPTLILAGLLLLASSAFAADAPAVPPDADHAQAALKASPRHGEWVEITVPGAKTPLKSFVVYPERKDKAPVVIVIHEIFGMTDWVRGVADQLAADGFIAIAPTCSRARGRTAAGRSRSRTTASARRSWALSRTR